MQRLMIAVFTFGACAVPMRASAKPRAPRVAASHAKSSPARAELPSEPDSTLYSKLVALADVDHDSVVSNAELELLVHQYVQKQVELRFGRLDRNQDAKVTRDEVPSMAAERFGRFDTNGDGSFTVAELAEVMHQQAAASSRVAFARLDVDGDGALSASDRESARPARISKREVPTPPAKREVAR
ncbi:MAG TPA: hypothetical protein VFZ53_21880 [Polyangiaceae bacterium]